MIAETFSPVKLKLDPTWQSRVCVVEITLLPNSVYAHTLRGNIKTLLVNMHKYLKFILNSTGSQFQHNLQFNSLSQAKNTCKFSKSSQIWWLIAAYSHKIPKQIKVILSTPWKNSYEVMYSNIIHPLNLRLLDLSQREDYWRLRLAAKAT